MISHNIIFNIGPDTTKINRIMAIQGPHEALANLFTICYICTNAGAAFCVD